MLAWRRSLCSGTGRRISSITRLTASRRRAWSTDESGSAVAVGSGLNDDRPACGWRSALLFLLIHQVHLALDLLQAGLSRLGPLPVGIELQVFLKCLRRAGNGNHRPVGFELRLALLLDALDVVHGEQAAQMIVVVHHEQLVDAGAFGEKFVGARDGVFAEFLFVVGLRMIRSYF